MVFFRKKTSDTDTGTAEDDKFVPQPDKAQKWFDHARVAAERYDYDYALTCYAHGMRFDPDRMSMHEKMYEAAIQYLTRGGKPASGKELKKIGSSNPVERFAAAEFAWMKDINNPSLSLKLLEAAIEADQIEFCRWLAPKALNLQRRAKKPSKSAFVKAKNLFVRAEAWEEALAAGEDAYRLDPSDNELAAEINDLAAQRAMDQGGYEEAAKTGEGGFRKFVKDIDKQRELEEMEAIGAGEDVEQRKLTRAKRQYEETPNQPDVINLYASLLRKIGTPETLEEARRVYESGYQATGEYRFKMFAADIELGRLRRECELLEKQLEDKPDDEALQSRLKEIRQQYHEAKVREYRIRVKKYPTDRRLRFELGEVEFELGHFGEAMECFQQSKEEPKLRVRAGHMLGQCFAREGWHMEAIGELKEALEKIDATERDRELPIRYDLMLSLIESAKSERSLDLAKEALDICSGIARRDITFRDIRSKRKELDELIKELSS